jgi:N-acetylmuramoyl-L-alanine amidase
MKSLLFYLLQVILASGILYGYYHALFRNKKFHQYNRYFLLLATIISICVPFLNIPVYFDSEETKPIFLETLTVLSSDGFEEELIVDQISAEATLFNWKNILLSFYLLIAGFLFTGFVVALIRIARLIKVYPGEKLGNIHFINTNEPATPFSFFRWLFWNNKIELNSDNGQQIFRHELFHIRQKHSWDIIFLEIITLIFWINPFFHLIKKEIKAIHEFLADKFAAEENREWHYAELLLMQVLGSPNTRLTNPFFHNQIKRRIAMLTTSKKPGYQYLRKIMVLPLAAVIVGLFAFTYKTQVNNSAIRSGKPITIVVDAGHGGSDPGVMSIGKDISEAEITLTMAKQIQALAGEYNITVVMTREDEKFPGGLVDKNEALKKRVAISAETKPAAFLSLHVGATPDKEYQTKSSGIEAYISGKRPDNKGKILASAILQSLAGTYKTDLTVKQRNQEGIWILDQNVCPTVLLQCGFINNAADLDFFRNKDNQEKIARSILEAIVKFNNATENSTDNSSNAVSKDTIPKKKEPGSKVIAGYPANHPHEKVVTGSRSRKSNGKTVAGQPAAKLDEVVVVGYPSPKTNNANPVAGQPASKVSEVVVEGYPSPKSNPNVVTEQPANKVKEVIVVGYPSPKTNNANPVAGQPANKVSEVVVEGYPAPKSNPNVVTEQPANKVKEVIVAGYPSKKSNVER